MDASGSVADGLRILEGGAGFLPLAGAGLVRVTGPSHVDALQRVVSQDLRGMAPGAGRLALLLAPKGQFRALMAVFAASGETLLMAPPGRAAELAAAIAKYLALSRCAAELAPDPGGAVAVVGPGWAEAAAALGAHEDALAAGGWHGGAVGGEPVSWFGRTMLGVPGAVVAGGGAEVTRRLAAAGAGPVAGAAVELARIARGEPAWGAELTDAVLPPEVGIEDAAISYSKGCYVGQETMARMKTYGRPTRALVGLRQVAGEPSAPELPAALAAPGDDRPRGALTSWARHPERGGVGLALVRRELAAPGARLSGSGREFEVAAFPLW